MGTTDLIGEKTAMDTLVNGGNNADEWKDFVEVAWRTASCCDWGLCHNADCVVRGGNTYAMGVAGERCTCGSAYVSIGNVVQCK
jgi:hypothetical protein